MVNFNVEWMAALVSIAATAWAAISYINLRSQEIKQKKI